MKKYFLFFLTLFFLVGCNEQSTGNTENDFALKEKCSKYIAQEQKKAEEIQKETREYQPSTSLVGVFYSKKLNTCVTVRHHFDSNAYKAGINGSWRDYIDTLTGQYVSFLEDEKLSSATDEEKEKYLELLK